MDSEPMDLAPVLCINLNPRESECCACGVMLSDARHGLPMYEGEVVPRGDTTTDWAGFDACPDCYAKWERGEEEPGA